MEGKIAIDFETHLMSPEVPVPKPVCVSWCDGSSQGLLTGTSAMEGFLFQVLTKADLILAHNWNFEALVIFKYFPKLAPLLWEAMEQGRLFCTLVYERLLNNIRKTPIHRLGLDALVNQYLNIDISESKKDPESWRFRYSELDGVQESAWPKAAKAYAIQDSIYTVDIYRHQIREAQLKYKLSVNSGIALNLMAKTGILIDKDRLQTLKHEVIAFLQPRYEAIVKLGFGTLTDDGLKKNIKRLQEYITENYKDAKRTAKGQIDTKGTTLDELLLLNPADKILQYFREIKDYEKILSTYINRLEEANPYIYTDYTSVVSTGRTSSSQSSNYPSVNIQNQPRQVKGLTYDIRNCYIPRPGFKFISIDYAGLELASTAHQLQSIYKKSAMKDVINSGTIPVDMHSKLACQIKKCSYETFLNHKKEPDYAFYRQLAKPINLGFPGGIGYKVMRDLLLKDGVKTKYKVLYRSANLFEVKRLLWVMRQESDNLRIERLTRFEYALVYDELVGLKQKLFALYPELNNFLGNRHEYYQTGSFKRMQNDFGEWETEPMHRYNVHGTIRDWCTYTALCNGFLMQTPAAIGAKTAAYKLVKKYYQHQDVTLLAFIHDEFVLEVRDNAEKYKYIEDVSSIMIESMQEVLTSVRITVEASMMDYWSKAGGEWEQTYWKDPYKKDLRSLA